MHLAVVDIGPLVLTVLTLAMSWCALGELALLGYEHPRDGEMTGHLGIYACPGPLAADECPARSIPGVVMVFKLAVE